MQTNDIEEWKRWTESMGYTVQNGGDNKLYAVDKDVYERGRWDPNYAGSGFGWVYTPNKRQWLIDKCGPLWYVAWEDQHGKCLVCGEVVHHEHFEGHRDLCDSSLLDEARAKIERRKANSV